MERVVDMERLYSSIMQLVEKKEDINTVRKQHPIIP